MTSHYANALLLVLVMLDLYQVSTSRISACIRACALQGLTLAILPLALSYDDGSAGLIHSAVIGVETLLLKALLIPWLLLRTLRKLEIHREVEPYVSLHLSLLLGGALVGVAFWVSAHLPLPQAGVPVLLVPVALATVLNGFLIVVSRKKAITQVVGYLAMENGVFAFGLVLTRDMPFLVELAILLDVFVGVLVFGVVIRHIGATFSHIDSAALSELRD